MKYVHTNIVAKDASQLAEFYKSVFACTQVGTESTLMGDWLAKGTGVKSARITSIQLELPGYEKGGPALEIFEYSEIIDEQETPLPNRKGIRHLAFSVDDVEDIVEKVIRNGGKKLGELVRKEFKSGTLTFAYVTDPEGNIIELQNWQGKE